MKKLILYWVIVVVVLYLLFSFAIWDLNPSNWTSGSRVVFIVIAIIAAGGMYDGEMDIRIKGRK